MREIHALICFLVGVLVATVSGFGSAHANVVDEAVLDYRLGLFEDAFKRMLPMANDDHPRALFWIGKMYDKGRGTEQNLDMAYVFYHRAALLNDADAQNNLGLVYKYAKGQKRDMVKAMAWFDLAAVQGHRVARDNWDLTRSALTDAERSAATSYIAVLRDEIRRTVLAQQSQPSPPTGKNAPKSVSPAFSEGTQKTSRTTSEMPPTRSDVKVSNTHDESRVPDRPAVLPDRPRARESSETDIQRPVATKISVLSKNVTALSRSKSPSARKRFYAVQLGIFQDPSNVARIQAKATSNGISLNLENVFVGDHRYARLRHGGFAKHANAIRVAQRINQLFNVTSLVVLTSN